MGVKTAVTDPTVTCSLWSGCTPGTLWLLSRLLLTSLTQVLLFSSFSERTLRHGEGWILPRVPGVV